MNPSKGSKIFQKGKISQESSSIKNSAYSSKIRVESSKKSKVEDSNWIGTDKPQNTQKSQQTKANQVHPFDVFQSALGGSTAKSTSSPQKAPAQLIQDILKGLSDNTLTQTNPYYSQQSEQKLAQILTNKNKLNSYVSELQNEMFEVDSHVVKNYQILILLLKQLGNSDVQVKKTNKGMEIGFNKGSINRQQNQIEKLEKSLKEKEEQVKDIVEDYESVIRNFNDVIEKLLQERDQADFGKLSFK